MSYLDFDGSILLVYQETLDHFGLFNGQRVSKDKILEVIGFNASLGITKIHIDMAKEKSKT